MNWPVVIAWGDEAHVERLKTLWAEGFSAAQVSKKLYQEFKANYSRSSVIGKIHRLGLAGRAKPSKPARVPPAPRQVKAKSPIYSGDPRTSPMQKKLDAIEANAVAKTRVLGNRQTFDEAAGRPPRASAPSRRDAPGLRTILSVGPSECRWPIGDPQEATFTLCGKPHCVGPYCEAHAARACQPVPKGQPKTGNQMMRALRRWAA